MKHTLDKKAKIGDKVAYEASFLKSMKLILLCSLNSSVSQ